MRKEKINICIVDDHQIMIDGIKSLLKGEKDIVLVGEALNAKDALKIIKQQDVDILIMDVTMPGISGTELALMVKKENPEIKVVALTMHNDIATISEMLQAGASGYLLKNTGKEELLEAIHKVFNNESYYNQSVANALIGTMLKDEQPESGIIELTPREKEVLELITKEHSNKQIAEALFISERTVESHRKNIFQKTNTTNIVGLIKYAYKHKLI